MPSTVETRLPTPEPTRDSNLSLLEREILDLAIEGKTNKAISRSLAISLRSVERYRAAALQKLGVQTIVEAARSLEVASAKSEEVLLAAFRGCDTGMSVVTRDLTIVAVNGAYCRLLGYQEVELIGKPLSFVNHPDDHTANVVNANRLFAGATKEFRMQKRYLRYSGDVIAAELSVTVSRGIDGTPQIALGTVKVAG